MAKHKVENMEDNAPEVRFTITRRMDTELRNVLSHIEEQKAPFMRRHLRNILNGYPAEQREKRLPKI